MDILSPLPKHRSDVVYGVQDLGRSHVARVVQLNEAAPKVFDKVQLQLEELEPVNGMITIWQTSGGGWELTGGLVESKADTSP